MMISQVNNTFYKRPMIVIFASMVLTSIGLTSLFSISHLHSSDVMSSSFLKQLIFLGPAIIGLLLMVFIPRYLIHKYIYIIYAIVLCGLVLPFFSRTVAGTNRWIDLGFIGFQPSEFAKWVIVICLARYLSDHKLKMRNLTLDNFNC